MRPRNQDFCEVLEPQEETKSRRARSLLGCILSGPTFEELEDRLVNPTKYKESGPLPESVFRITSQGAENYCKPWNSCFTLGLKYVKVASLKREAAAEEIFAFSGSCEVFPSIPHLGTDPNCGRSARFKVYYTKTGYQGDIYIKFT